MHLRNTLIPTFFALCLVCAAASGTYAAPFPQPYNTEPDLNGPPAPEAAAAKFQLPEGFSARVFAAEPDVCNPIAMAWDAAGRLWIAENYTYAEAPKKFDLALRDRILIFEDENQSGHFTKRKVFTDELQMLTSIEIGHGGVWAMCPPQLIFIPTGADPDVPAGAPQVVLDGFHIPAESYHNFANGLRWGPDGWLYGRCGGTAPADVGIPGTAEAERIPLRGGMWRYHPKRKVFEALNSGTTNPWGHDWDKHGELFFVNTVNGHLWHSITGGHFVRGTSLDPNPRAYALIDQHADHWHFDTNQNWSKSRDGAANAFGGGHAHIGAMIYKGTNWPAAFQDRLFTFNMHGLRANQEVLEREGSGYVGRHGEDLMFANDPWFRGLDLSAGPDGGVFAIDWCDTGECHERNGIHRTSGRVFKFQYGEVSGRQAGPLGTMSPIALASLQTHPNDWQAAMARRVLADRAAAGSIPREGVAALLGLFESSPSVVEKLRALWSLYVIGEANPEFLKAQLTHKEEHVRVWAVRLLSDSWGLDLPTSKRPSISEDEASIAPLAGEFARMAAGETSGLVRLALASALQRLPFKLRAELACALAAHAEDARDHNLPLLVWYGLIPLAEADPSGLLRVNAKSEWPQLRQFIARRLAEDIESNPLPINHLIEGLPTSGSEARIADALQGLTDGLKGWRKAAKPRVWDAFAARLQQSAPAELSDRVRDLSVVFGDGRALDDVRRVALDNTAELSARKSALQTLADNKAPNLRKTCEDLLNVRFLNPVAARGLASFDEPQIAEKLVRAYGSFHQTERNQLIATIVSRESFVKPLLYAISEGKIPRTALSPFDVRQIRNFNNTELNAQLATAWGELRESSSDKKAVIAQLKAEFNPDALALADRSQGRVVFQNLCGACHMLYGEGGKIGPDLTGAGRDNLDYLLENVVDPNAVVGADFRTTIVNLRDGRVLSGMIRDKTQRTLGVQTMTEKVVIDREEINKMEELPVSLMPEGLLESLSAEQRRNLVGYLIQKTQVPLPSDVKR